MISTSDDLDKQLAKIVDPNEKNFVKISIKVGLDNPIPLEYNHVKIDDSERHGMGLFSTEDIPEGVIVTYYPVHACFVNHSVKYPFPNDDFDLDFMKGIVNRNYDSIYGFCWFNTNFDNYQGIIGNPKKVGDSLLLAHMINDPGGNVFSYFKHSEISSQVRFKRCVFKYWNLCLKFANCKFVTHPKYPLCYVVTTKNIKKGEELLAPYFLYYWYYKQYHKDDFHDKFKELFKNHENFRKWFFKNVYEKFDVRARASPTRKLAHNSLSSTAARKHG